MRSAFSSSKTKTIADHSTGGWECRNQVYTAAVRYKLSQLGGVLGLLLLLLALNVQPTLAQSGSRQTEQVDLLVFAAEQQQDLVQVAWQVSQPASQWNFVVYRGPSDDFAQAEAVAAPIFSSASSSSAVVDYSLSDDSSGVATQYWLVARGDDNREQIFGPYAVQQRLALFLPLIFQAY